MIIRTWQTAHVDEARAGRAARRRARTTTCGPAATSPSTRSAPPSRTACDHEIGSVETGKLADLVLWRAGLLRRAARRGDQGRRDRLGADGRRQRLDPHAAAGAPRPMFGAWAGDRRPRRRTLRRAGRARGGARRRSALSAARRRCADCRGLGKADMPPQRRSAGDHGRPGHFPGPRRRRLSSATPAARAAHGPAVLPVLMCAAGTALARRLRLPAGGLGHSGGVEARDSRGLAATHESRAWRRFVSGPSRDPARARGRVRPRRSALAGPAFAAARRRSSTDVWECARRRRRIDGEWRPARTSAVQPRGPRRGSAGCRAGRPAAVPSRGGRGCGRCRAPTTARWCSAVGVRRGRGHTGRRARLAATTWSAGRAGRGAAAGARPARPSPRVAARPGGAPRSVATAAARARPAARRRPVPHAPPTAAR